ncbi:MAG: 50S ribosomal protein L22 [Planctomycetes bacterium]|nr:50S ribosomal protein L22 [Planctomycetota bacterium]
MAYTNIHRGVRMSMTKVRPVICQIRGKRLDEAVTMMALSKKRCAVFIRQALLAAKANADQAEADLRGLYVVEARVDAGPTMKRFQPKDRGRSHQILKRSCHITVSVDVKAAAAKRSPEQAA